MKETKTAPCKGAMVDLNWWTCRVLILILMAFTLSTPYSTADELGEVTIYLKSGSIIRGTMIDPESEDRVTIQTEDGMVVEIHIENIERIEEHANYKTVKSERRRHGGILIGVGVALTAFGFILRLEPELRGSGLNFPNTLFLAGAILGTSGLYLYLTGGAESSADMAKLSLHHSQVHKESEIGLTYEW